MNEYSEWMDLKNLKDFLSWFWVVLQILGSKYQEGWSHGITIDSDLV